MNDRIPRPPIQGRVKKINYNESYFAGKLFDSSVVLSDRGAIFDNCTFTKDVHIKNVDCHFKNCEFVGKAKVVISGNSVATFDNCKITGIVSDDSFGIFSGNSIILFENCKFSYITIRGKPLIDIKENVTLRILKSGFKDIHASIISTKENSNADIVNSEFKHLTDSCIISAGGVSSVSVNFCKFKHIKRCADGFAVSLKDAGVLFISRSYFEDIDGCGAILLKDESNLVLSESTFRKFNNISDINGVIVVSGNAQASIRNSEFSAIAGCCIAAEKTTLTAVHRTNFFGVWHRTKEF